MQVTGRQLKALAKMVSNDIYRERLNYLWLDSDPNGMARIWVTDGHQAIALVSAKIKGPKRPIPYDVERISRLKPKDVIEVGKFLYCSLLELHPAHFVSDPVNIDAVIPERLTKQSLTKTHQVLGLGSKLMVRVFQTIGHICHLEESQATDIQYGKDNQSPIGIFKDCSGFDTKSEDHFKLIALIMPCRLNDSDFDIPVTKLLKAEQATMDMASEAA